VARSKRLFQLALAGLSLTGLVGCAGQQFSASYPYDGNLRIVEEQVCEQGSCTHYVYAHGAITRNAVSLIHTANIKMTPESIVLIDSPGGSLSGARKLAEQIRFRGAKTELIGINHPMKARYMNRIKRTPLHRCLSACTVIFLGGRERRVPDGARFGVHAPHNGEGEELSEDRSASIQSWVGEFARKANVGDGYMELMFETPSKTMRVLNRTELTELGITTGR